MNKKIIKRIYNVVIILLGENGLSRRYIETSSESDAEEW